jgi:predicted nucleic acid-binding protein
VNEAPIVVFDACVIYPAPLRDLLMWLAKNGLVSARWSEEILAEWVENLLINRPDLKRERLLRTCSEMNRAVPDAMVSGYEPHIDTITLPDENDRHVVAAAVAAEATFILTANLKDFPRNQLPAGIMATAPDPFLCELFSQFPDEVLETMREHRQMLKKPSKTVEEYLATLTSNGLVTFVEAVRIHLEVP